MTHLRGRKATVVVVDDDFEVLQVIAQFLRTQGYIILEAQSPAGAIAKLKESRDGPDLLLSDYAMPGMNGLELGSTLRNIQPRLSIIFMTGNEEAQGKTTALGFTCLRKPLDFGNLVTIIETALGACM